MIKTGNYPTYRKISIGGKNKGYNLSVGIYNLYRKNNEKILYNLYFS